MDDDLKPLRIFGVVLIVLDLIGVVFFWNLFFDPNSPIYPWRAEQEYPFLFFNFWVGSTIFYFLTGIGIIFPTRWGYLLFKLFLYLLFMAFPIGTYISYKTLSYMKRHQIKRHFFQ